MFDFFLEATFSKKLFWIGIFLIASAPSISFILLLISALFSIKSNLYKLTEDKWNLFFIFSALLMPLVCLFHTDNIIPLKDNWNISLTWLGLTNWLPLIFCFLSFQFFLKTPKDREVLAKLLIAGSLPVLVSGFAQYFLKIHGPFQLLNGLIIWFQRPLQQETGMSALFNNQNYAGSWFCIVWPFTLAAFIESLKNKLNKYICLSFLISITVAIVLTTSRSAWGGLILLIPLVTGFTSLLYLLPIFLLLIIIIFLAVGNSVPTDFQEEIRRIIPTRLWQEFKPEFFAGKLTRVQMWNEAIFFISQKPIFGWGAATYPVLFFYAKNIEHVGHAHNLILELSLSYGMPITILIFTPIFLITIFSFSKIFVKKSFSNTNYFERAWFSSFFVLLCSQLVDIQYFDGRISVIFWILLAGLNEINKSNGILVKT